MKRILILAAALALSQVAPVAAAAEETRLGPALKAYAPPVLAAQRRRPRRAVEPPALAFRIGVHLNGDSSLLLGLDLGVPSISIGAGWLGRIDLDFWNFGDNKDTVIAATLNQITTATDGSAYYGFGIGLVNAKETDFAAKLLLGTRLSDRVSGELNLYLAPDVDLAILARIHL